MLIDFFSFSLTNKNRPSGSHKVALVAIHEGHILFIGCHSCCKGKAELINFPNLFLKRPGKGPDNQLVKAEISFV
jgi:hypothetical protein